MRRYTRAAMVLALLLGVAAPATAERDVVGLVAQAPNRYVPSEVGKPVDLHYVFGPYAIPPGQDSNRITVDLPAQNGFIVAVAPDLIDATTGRIPTQQEAHIHHAHWFRVTDDPDQEYYPGLDFGGRGASWVFGTGEEKTQGRLDDRARLEPENLDADPTNDFNYGIEVEATTPQVLIYMIHNKLSTVGNYFVILDVTFIPGTEAEIEAATGKDMRPLYSQLWGQTKDVTDSSTGIGARWTVTRNGTAIASGSHLHPGGKMVTVSNLGPDVDPTSKVVPLCQGIDPDGDGYDGVAILNSFKYDHDMNAWPYSEDYQMGASKFGWRAPLHAGDILEQRASYAVKPMAQHSLTNIASRDQRFHNWYEAMSYTGIYMDRAQTHGPAPTSCTLAAFAPTLLGPDTFEAQGVSSSWQSGGTVKPELAAAVNEIGEDFNLFLDATPTAHQRAIHGMVNHTWKVTEDLCAQPGMPSLAGKPACGASELATEQGPEVTSISVANFIYLPGDFGLSDTPLIPQVRAGTTLRFINEDAALNIRHTFTSCEWPCKGRYVSNFPLPSGGASAFDTGKIGNIDPVDGGADVQAVILQEDTDTIPFYDFKVTLDPGRYSYFCRIHPFMRGGFEVIPA